MTDPMHLLPREETPLDAAERAIYNWCFESGMPAPTVARSALRAYLSHPKWAEYLARAMHDSYEAAATRHGWQTNVDCRVPFENLPVANRNTMLESAQAVINKLMEGL